MDIQSDTATSGKLISVAAGADRYGELRSLGISTISFKLTAQSADGVLIIEQRFYAKGGPARHLHFSQDEWFYVVDGEFLIEVGAERQQLHQGDSLLAPRNVPHVWAHVGDGSGRMLIAFMPAGKMEAFFREVTRAQAMPPQDPALWLAHDMQLLGPPLALP